MNKKILISAIVVVLIIVLGAVGYLCWSKKIKTNIFDSLGDMAGKITDSATKGVLPSLNTNPLGSKPDINPADKANPFKDIKINPFE